MKQSWSTPKLEVLDVNMTMKFWPPHKPPGGGDDDHDPGFPGDVLDS